MYEKLENIGREDLTAEELLGKLDALGVRAALCAVLASLTNSILQEREIHMRSMRSRAGVVCTAMLVVAVAALGLAGSASAKLTGEFTKFSQCPFSNLEVKKCLYSPTTGGEVVLGSKTVPIVNEAVLQGGFGKPDPETRFSKFFGASNGVTLSKAAQPVPGGLAGIVNCKAISNFIVRIACEATFENGLTGLNSTLELAKPASEIKISENHLAEEEGVALKLPVRVHLENPFLGSECFVGSSSSPIWWELTTGTTSPPGPNKPITGYGGELELREEGSVLLLNKAVLVDNAWAAPGVTGCGGFGVELILNPIINSAAGLPAAAGKNTAILKNNINVAAGAAVRLNNEENP